METIYAPGPVSVPESLRQPTRKYLLHTWLAISGLILFAVSYCLLTYWFIRIGYRMMLRLYYGIGGVWELGVMLGAAFLAVFMIKAFFFIKRAGDRPGVEVTPVTQPRLFEFLYRLADEAGAPRPHRVFLSPEVNACVYYDLSVLNLILPSKKNLEIGLGLVNVLSLGELKAVLAHEFGHFAQRAMAVGRWAHTAQQIAEQVVARRDKLDTFLAGLSAFDIRIAWVGWILSLVIWGIRSLVETAFHLVMLTNRVLSREMEMQADLVSVSLTGSDALIQALHRLTGADHAWDSTREYALKNYEQGKVIGDAFAIQSALIEHLREIYDDPSFAGLPQFKDSEGGTPGERRIFRPEIAHPPQMWSTHPLNHEREENAKRFYVEAPIDPRSAWDLFDDVASLREEVTQRLFTGMAAKEASAPLPIEKTLEEFREQFSTISNRREYGGIYMGRSIVINFERASDLYSPPHPDIDSALNQLDPEPIRERLERLRVLTNEKTMLDHLLDGTMTAPNGVIKYRGNELQKSQLPTAISEVEAEIEQLVRSVDDYDRLCRTVHRAIALRSGQGWDEYLTSLINLLHYVDHTQTNLQDAMFFLKGSIQLEFASGRVDSAGLERILHAARDLYRALEAIFSQRGQVMLNEQLAKELETESWSSLLGEFKLPEPTAENFGQWTSVLDSWLEAVQVNLAKLSVHLLNQLLESERRIGAWYRQGEPAEVAPAPLGAPANYRTLSPGNERRLELKLNWWSRFQNAVGIGPAIARFAIALLIVGGVVYAGSTIAEKRLTIYNGLGRTVLVTVNGDRHKVYPTSNVEVDLPASSTFQISSVTNDLEEIESFEAAEDEQGDHYVYNIASASPMVQWILNYTEDPASAQPPQSVVLGTPRWFATKADFIFRDPPARLKIDARESKRRIALLGYGDSEPSQMLYQLADPESKAALIRTHARWEPSDSSTLPTWLSYLPETKEGEEMIAVRLMVHPEDVAARRERQNRAEGTERKREVCEQDQARAKESPLDPDRQYLAIRCLDSEEASARAFKEAYRQFPSNRWLGLAVSQTLLEERRWEEARAVLEGLVGQGVRLENVVLDLARLRRLLNDDGELNLKDLVGDSSYLQYALGQNERGEPGETTDPYLYLEEGKLSEVITHLPAEPKVRARLLRLVAASDGATREMIEQALALPPQEGIDPFTVLPTLAVAIRNGVDHRPYLDQMIALGLSREGALMRFVETIIRGGSPSAATAALGRASQLARAQAYLFGVLMRGEKAPPEWRILAQRTLFEVERPFLK
jgi:Zn-dependent protease with chaperone function